MIALSVSRRGFEIGERICAKLKCTHKSKWRDSVSVRSVLEEAFNAGVPLIAVMALPGLVRILSHLVKDKLEDPPVVAVDDGGKFAVVVLGAHRGGNELAAEVAEVLGAMPVITDATSALGLPSVEEIAKLYGARPTREAILRGNAAIVNGLRIAVVLVGVEGPDAQFDTYRFDRFEDVRALAERYDEVLVVSRERPPVGLWLAL